MTTPNSKQEALYQVRGPKSIAEMTEHELERALAASDIVLVACASTEPHGPHLPLGSDTLQGDYLIKRTVEKLRELGVTAVAGPTIPFGLATNRFERPDPWPGNVFLTAGTYRAVLYEVCLRLLSMGFRKIALVVSHVENEPVMHTVAKELADNEGAQVIVANWVTVLQSHYHRILQSRRSEGHAGEGETARVMAVAPGLVDTNRVEPFYPASLAGPEIEQDRLPYFGGAVGVYFPWRQNQPSPGYTGSPGLATIEAGEKCYEVMADWVARTVRKYFC